ncbi:MAG: NUDIX domain-containing protein [Planctomycetales bacterium]|nr:NUDIX domain-containing protein [Planctomycetales bacterium]NIM09884.1 NUDIX domain-containing protein [Planctomycetales bacterium]NIN09323.1 NUDIX domain-containing protein [Planctomycetales bacterium]NIN78431.1 NUDIX domain-containing protein [Planctomycetales bacterium]NIO35622.1 NUDIX domain-containing protein [Planctomycetales bacterium]
MAYSYAYPRPAVTVDCVVFGLDEDDLKALLIQRDRPPFADQWALPGGFVEIDETLEEAARRELREETGLDRVFLEQLYTFGQPDRDPRQRVITVAYYALVKLSDHRVRAATDARDTAWFSINQLPDLAFDHAQIVETARQRLRGKVRYQPIGFELLPHKFPLRDLQKMYETILNRPLDKRNFRKKILSMGVLVELDETEREVPHRAARLYRFDKKSYKKLTREGFDFEI